MYMYVHIITVFLKVAYQMNAKLLLKHSDARFQIVWAETYAVGCAHAFCPQPTGGFTAPNSNYVVCNYGPPYDL